MTTPPKGPVLIDLDEKPAPRRRRAARIDAPKETREDKANLTPATAPPVPDGDYDPPTGQAMTTMAALAARKPSRIGRWFWSLLIAIIFFALSVAAWDFVAGLIERSAVLGYIAVALIGLFAATLLVIALRELAAFGRLRKLDRIHKDAEAALLQSDIGLARKTVSKITALYSGRADAKWGVEKLKSRKGDVVDPDTLFGAVETDLLGPLDAAAMREVEAAARQVATVTALVPLAFADVIAALTSNLRMIRRIAEVYGGRAGTVGSWRLTRNVLTHLVATGAVAVGDDLIGSLAGGGMLSKISRRFGEGLVNGALTARVGVAAMEVCRPLPFRVTTRPSVTGLVKRALTGLVSS